MEIEELDFDPVAVAPSPVDEVEALDFDPVPTVPMNTPTAEELQGFSEPDPARASLVAKPKELQSGGFTEEEANTIPQGDMDVEQTVQYNRDSAVANQYKDYQSGPNAGKIMPDDFEVTTDMYEKSQNPNLLYENLRKTADGTDITGQKTYKGRVIPTPQHYDNAGTATDLVADTIRDTGKNTVTAIAAGLDEFNQSLGFNTNLTKMAQESIADAPKAEKVSHALSKELLRAGTSVALGAKAGKMTGNTTAQNKINTWVLSMAGALALETLTKNADEENLVVGDNSLVQLNEGFKPSEGKTDADKFWRKKGDQALDSALTAGPVAGVAELGLKGAKLVKNTTGKIWSSFFPNKDAIAKEEAEAFLKLAGIDTPEKIAGIQKKLQEEGSVTIGFGDDTITPVTIKRSSMSAIAEGAEKEGDSLLANAAMEQEKVAHKQGNLSTSFDDLKQQPVRTLAKVQKEAVDSRGGIPAIEQTKNLLANQAVKQLDDNTQRVTSVRSSADDMFRQTQKEAVQKVKNKTLETDINVSAAEDIVSGSRREQEIAEQGLQELYKTDRTFAKTVNELSQETGIGVGTQNKAEASSKILPRLVQGVKNMKEQKNGRYTKVAQLAKDVPINEESFTEALLRAREAKALPADAERMLTNELGDDVNDIENLSYGQIYNMLPKINGALYKLRNSADADRQIKIDALEALRDNINLDQLDEIVKLDDVGEDLKKAVVEAKRYYTEEYIRFARDSETPVGMLFDAFDNAYNEKFAKFNPETGKLEDLGFNYLMKDKSQKVAEDGVSQKIGSSEQVNDFIKHPDTGEDLEDSFLNIHRAEVADAIAVIRRSGKEPTGEDIAKVLQSKGVSLKNSYPEFSVGIDNFIKRLDESQTAVKTTKETVKTAEKALEDIKVTAKDELKAAKTESKDLIKQSKATMEDTVSSAEKEAKDKNNEVLKSAVGKYFLEKAPDGTDKRIPVGNGYDSFKKLLSKPGNENKLRFVAEQIKKSGDKQAQEGFEGAMFELMRENMISDANSFKVKGAQISKFLSDSKSLKDYGKIIFSNTTDPKEAAKKMDTFTSVLKLVDVVNNEQLKTVSSTSALGQEKDQTVSEAKKAANYLIGVIFGRFNSTSFRLSSTTGRLIDATTPEEKRRAVITALHSDPKYFSEVLNVVKEAISNPTSELGRNMMVSGILTGKNSLTDEQKDTIKSNMPEGVL